MIRRGYGGPQRYVQGPGVIHEIGETLKSLGARALVVVDGFFWETLRPQIAASLQAAGITSEFVRFGGESSQAEIGRCVEAARAFGAAMVVGVGGGKSLDTAKITAFRTGARIVTVPTIASTDSPTSAIGVIYSPDGVYDRVIRGGRNPDVVLVDSALIVQAPVRFLASGMGDALSTFFEARSNLESHSNNYVGEGKGYRPTIAGYEIARACHATLMRDGRSAFAAASAGRLTAAVETIIEANTLLSGLGFENCGVSAAHGIHDALTVLEPTHHFFHGEKVAFGVIGLLVLENRPPEELNEALDFCIDLGLPTTLADLGLGAVSAADMARVGEAAMLPASVIHATPVPLTAGGVADAIWTASALATERKRRRGTGDASVGAH